MMLGFSAAERAATVPNNRRDDSSRVPSEKLAGFMVVKIARFALIWKPVICPHIDFHHLLPFNLSEMPLLFVLIFLGACLETAATPDPALPKCPPDWNVEV